MKVKIAHIIIGLVSIAAMSACGGYNKIFKTTDNELKYKVALSYFEKKDYGRATPLFEQLTVPFSNTKRDDTVHFYLAKGYWGQGDYYSGAYYLDNFCKTFGRSPFVEEAYYLRSLCYYHDSYRYELDQANTIRAISSFNEMLTRYPDSPHKGEAEKYATELTERMEEKSFYGAKLYYQIDDYRSAVVALRNSVNDYPDSKFKEEGMFLILKSSYLYAKYSIRIRQKERYIAAIDEYYNFASEFPQSRYTKEAESMYKDALQYVEKNKTAEELLLEKQETQPLDK
ncbi:MAG: outer membrane protein assembly factor BamD [Prevotellaceae bacterium]|jgi:outer membrane protein assembly factor BamD|nr:outer membrane protein assembly factor BamD [Prevotellaceae bacterium]